MAKRKKKKQEPFFGLSLSQSLLISVLAYGFWTYYLRDWVKKYNATHQQLPII